MSDPRERARRNLLLFWLVLIGLPIAFVWACTAAFGPIVQNP
jgi:hypothetical protein